MAKSVPPEQAVVDGLERAIKALPTNLPMTGKDGLFAGGKGGLEVVKLALGKGFLEEQEVKPKKGKAKVYAIITGKGVQHWVDAVSPKAALEALLPAVQSISKRPEPPSHEAFQADLDRATATCVNAIQEAFSELRQEVSRFLNPRSESGVDPDFILGAIRHALERIKPVEAPALAGPTDLGASLPCPASLSPSSLEEGIVTFVDAWAKEKAAGCQFDVLWNHLKERQQGLTIGAFQDALRTLYEAGRIRLGGWPRMLDDLPQPQLALFVSSKVMYYANPGQSSQ